MIDAGRRSGAVAGGIRLAGCALLTIAGLWITSATASASDLRYWTSFGGGLIGDERYSPNEADIAVDNSLDPSAHDVYVSDTGNHRILKFSPEGEFILMFGDEVDATTGGDVCTAASGDQCQAGIASPWVISEEESSPGFSVPTMLAVDGSAGPTGGDIYVVDRAHGRVLRFNPAGYRDTLWAAEGELRLSGATGVAVNANGRLLVLDLEPSGDRVRTFDSNAVELGSLNVNTGGYREELEVDDAGDIYVGSSYYEVAKLSSNGTQLGEFGVESGWVTGFAVDAASEKPFLSRAERGIAGFAAGCLDLCSPVETFGEGYVGWAGDLALDESDGRLYAIAHEGGASVAVFLPASQIPEVTTEASVVRGEHEAVLHGKVDAIGGPPAIYCRFEYVTEAEFQADRFAGALSVPCAETAPISTVSAVTARVTGLERGTWYRYRLVVETADRTIVGLDEQFETPLLPRAQTGKALIVGPGSALLSGSVESPAARPILKCEFEVIADDALKPHPEALSIPCAPIPFYNAEVKTGVTGEVAPLRPDSTYSYRIIVVNIDGTVRGQTQTFTTASAPPPPPEEEIEEPHHRRPHPPPRAIPCAEKACTRTLDGSPHARIWVSPRFPSTYGWLFEISVNGHPLHHTALVRGCRSTFAGHGVIARLNACHGRFRIVYRGSGSIRFQWRVFAQCRCGEVAGASRSAAAVVATGP